MCPSRKWPESRIQGHVLIICGFHMASECLSVLYLLTELNTRCARQLTLRFGSINRLHKGSLPSVFKFKLPLAFNMIAIQYSNTRINILARGECHYSSSKLTIQSESMPVCDTINNLNQFPRCWRQNLPLGAFKLGG